VNEGNYHDYLGVNHYSNRKARSVKMSMIKNLEKAFEDFPEDISRTASTPASDHLFRVREAERRRWRN
jgi:hypothetical protein